MRLHGTPRFRRFVAVAATCLAPVLLIAGAAAPASATFSGRNGKIAFGRLTKPNVRVWVMRPDGTDLSVLTGKKRVARTPAWSPDGSTIVFVRSVLNRPEELFTMSEDGGHVLRLTHNDHLEGWPTWSPDGKRIAFVCCGGPHRSRILSIRSDGGGRRRLRFDASDPDWSPDGTRIAFDAGGQIKTMNPHGKDVQQVTTAGGYEPSWSPNGRWPVFVNEGDVFKIRPDGTRLTQLTSTSIEESWPSWSPNGERIVYLQTRSNYEREIFMAAIWRMRGDGAKQERLLRQVSDWFLPLETPDWQPRPARA